MNPVLTNILGKLHSVQDATPDAELLARFATQHDQAAFELLLWRHGSWVLRVCRSVLHHAQDAEDAFQVVFLILARKAASIRQGQSLNSWLMKTAYRVCFRLQKGSERYRGECLVEPPTTTQSDSSADESHIIHQEVRKLPTAYQQAITLFYFCHFTTRQIAEQLNCPRGTVLSRLAEAKRLLKKRLALRGITPTTLTAGLSLAIASQTLSHDLLHRTLLAAMRLAEAVGATTLHGLISDTTLRLLEDSMKLNMLNRSPGLLATVTVLVLGTGIGLWSYQPPGQPSQEGTSSITIPLREPTQASSPPAVVMEPVPPPVFQNPSVIPVTTSPVIPAIPSAEGAIQINMPTGSWQRSVDLTLPVPVSVIMGIQFHGKQMTTTLKARLNQKALDAMMHLSKTGTEVAAEISQLTTFKDLELSIKLEGEFSLSADGLLYGVITGVEVDNEILQKALSNPLLIKMLADMDGIGEMAFFAPMLEMAGGVLMDQPFSMRFRMDQNTLSLKDLKIAGLDLASRFIGPYGAIYPAVTNGRFKRQAEDAPVMPSVKGGKKLSQEQRATEELRLATALENEGEVAKAFYQYELVQRKYPNSKEAKLAQQRSTLLIKE